MMKKPSLLLAMIFISKSYATPIDPNWPKLQIEATDFKSPFNNFIVDDVTQISLRKKDDKVESFVLPDMVTKEYKTIAPLLGQVKIEDGKPYVEYQIKRKIVYKVNGSPSITYKIDTDWTKQFEDTLHSPPDNRTLGADRVVAHSWFYG